jgi:hypothetical protein
MNYRKSWEDYREEGERAIYGRQDRNASPQRLSQRDEEGLRRQHRSHERISRNLIRTPGVILERRGNRGDAQDPGPVSSARQKRAERMRRRVRPRERSKEPRWSQGEPRWPKVSRGSRGVKEIAGEFSHGSERVQRLPTFSPHSTPYDHL